MNINIDPILEPTLTVLASGQGTTKELYAKSVIEKHLLARLKQDTADKIAGLPLTDIKQVSDNIVALHNSKIPLETPKEAGIISN